MTPEAQRIAIAEAYGWTLCDDWQRPNIGKWWEHEAQIGNPKRFHNLPDYLNDYNAIRDVLDTLGISNGNNPELRIAWMAELHKIVGRRRPKNKVGTPIVSDMDKMFAERKELVEATLRAIGKWEGGAE